MIGGKVAHKISPHTLGELAANRSSVLVSGTNGKSTTNAMVCAALEELAPVASNRNGDNMTSGVISALMSSPKSRLAALEVDEMHLVQVAAQVKPKVFVLLNLSRDQLDRVGEIGKVERVMRQAINQNPQAHVIANCDDPLIASAAWEAKRVTWVSVGSAWHDDSVSFPRGGGNVIRRDRDWWVTDGSYRRPDPDWIVQDNQLHSVHDPTQSYDLALQIPGQANRGNAAQAALAAQVLGLPLDRGICAVSEVKQVAGRYRTYQVAGRQVHLLLAKNPAGWQEALTMLDPQVKNLIIAVNGQVADSKDLSWLWDVRFEHLPQTYPQISVCGDRAADLAVRLQYAGVKVKYFDQVLAAVKAQPLPSAPPVPSPDTGSAHASSEAKTPPLPPGGIPVELLANYTAFRDTKALFEQLNQK